MASWGSWLQQEASQVLKVGLPGWLDATDYIAGVDGYGNTAGEQYADRYAPSGSYAYRNTGGSNDQTVLWVVGGVAATIVVAMMLR